MATGRSAAAVADVTSRVEACCKSQTLVLNLTSPIFGHRVALVCIEHASTGDRLLVDTDRLDGLHKCAFKRSESWESGHSVYRRIRQGMLVPHSPWTLQRIPKQHTRM